MERKSFENALQNLLKARGNSQILKHLIAVRKEMDWTRNKLHFSMIRDKGCMKVIVASLQTTQKNIIDVSLSIIGNYCTDRNYCQDVIQHDILSRLIYLSKNFTKEDSINGRMFRIIGNISKHRQEWANTIVQRKPEIVDYIVTCLKEEATVEKPGEICSEATIIMGVRCFRELLNSDTLNTLVSEHSVLKAIGCLFIKYGDLWKASKKHENVLNNLVKTLHEYSKYKYFRTISELKVTEKGNVFLLMINILLFSLRIFVKIIMNLLKTSSLQSDLPIPEICDELIKVIENYNVEESSMDEYFECIQCLCFLFVHPANRTISRCGKSISALINVLKNFDSQSDSIMKCCALIIDAFNKCAYDEILLKEQLRLGIVPVLITKLEWLVGSRDFIALKHKYDRKRKFSKSFKLDSGSFGITDDSLKNFNKSPTSSEDEDLFLFNKRVPSPCSSSSSDYSWSYYCQNSDTSDSDDYSPVCSDIDEKSPLEEGKSPDIDKLSDITIDAENVPYSDKDNVVNATHIQEKFLNEISMLLRTYLRLEPAPVELVTQDLMRILLKCSNCFSAISHRCDTLKIIFEILNIVNCLIPIMQTDFIPLVYSLTNTQHNLRCFKCSKHNEVGVAILSKLNKIAESDLGKGQIEHTLFCGSEKAKKEIILVFPYVITNKVILAKLSLNCGALEVLINLLKDDSELQMKSIDALCAISHNIMPQKNNKISKISKYVDLESKEILNVSGTAIVTFLLDDGNIVVADRDFLSEKSDYFYNLLNGSFAESSQNEITLPNVDHKALDALLRLLYYDLHKNDVVNINLDVEILLEVILLCDRYLLIDLCSVLKKSVQLYHTSHKTIPYLYHWSLESGTNFFRNDSIQYALMTKLHNTERCAMFRKLFDLDCNEILVNDIQKIILKHLEPSKR